MGTKWLTDISDAAIPRRRVLVTSAAFEQLDSRISVSSQTATAPLDTGHRCRRVTDVLTGPWQTTTNFRID
ncbi:hypothetical protein BIW11_04576 [Tropilaelaps mercedesae]|uniref:Uncharacterized protein n=1 Tax=Tropilaelaps mercedesae TaxID=418985 RepID=A0A1V9X414_9ACAR|nr:hypothetical protein BIW11_04576 [Tropilaelaps mercedesae]